MSLPDRQEPRPEPWREEAGDRAPSAALCERVRRALERGRLVALPTETVYGIAARADRPGALDALRRLKRRPDRLALTWHPAHAAQLDRFPSVSPMARRLAARYWPGPLTLVLPGVPPGLEGAADEGWTGVRVPAHKATAGILAALEFPVVMSSANRHGEAPLTSADAVARAFEGDADSLELVVDGGPARLAESSSVLRIGPARFELLREGLFGLEELRATAGMRLAFVCTGNTCRSPMAEGLARKLLSERLEIRPERLSDFGFRLRSMGVSAAVGEPASRLATQVSKVEGVDLGAHRSRAALAEDLASFDRIYCMTRGHVDALVRALPPGRDQNLVLMDPRGEDVPDPMGGTKADYQSALHRIRAALEQRLPEWV